MSNVSTVTVKHAVILFNRIWVAVGWLGIVVMGKA
jgi:hypothetical protein